MKKAFVIAITFILGLGVMAFAGPISGSWSTTLGIDPGAAVFTALDSTLAVDYTTGGWTFGSSSSFTLSGFSSQSFTASGTLGAFSFSSTMEFDPMAVTVKDYTDFWDTNWAENLSQTPSDTICPITYTTATEPKFLTWQAEGSVSIAGVEFGGLFYLDQSHYPVTLTNYATKLDSDTQTTTYVCASYYNGSGWRFKVAGSIGDATVTSYTYFNLSEPDVSTKYCPAVGKKGSGFSIADPDCTPGFYEEYIMVEGLTFGCATVDAALSITCDGFSDLAIVTKDIGIGGWLELDFGITFTLTDKTTDFCLSLVDFLVDCFTIELGLDNVPSDDTGIINSLVFHGIGFSHTWNGISFTSYTELDEYSALFSGATAWSYLYSDTEDSYMIPYVGRTNVCTAETATYLTVADEFYELKCVATERYKLWEKFIIDVDADSCCGGVLDFTVSTFFGDHQVLDYVAYDVILAGETTVDTTIGLVPLYGTGAEGTDALDVGDEEDYDIVTFKTGYAADDTDTLFDWAETTVDASIGVGSNITLDLGFDVSAFGWEELEVGFTFTF